jgi:hypothetical protein
MQATSEQTRQKKILKKLAKTLASVNTMPENIIIKDDL